MAELIARTTFDAAFVASDVVALGAIGALREAGLQGPRRRVDRRLRRHPSRRLLRPTPHHRPAAGLRARAGRRTGAPRAARRSDETRTGRYSRPSSSCAARRPVDAPDVRGPGGPRHPIAPEHGPTTGSVIRERRKGMEERTNRRSRIAALIAGATLLAAACSSGTASPSPAASSGGGASARAEHRRRQRGAIVRRRRPHRPDRDGHRHVGRRRAGGLPCRWSRRGRSRPAPR